VSGGEVSHLWGYHPKFSIHASTGHQPARTDATQRSINQADFWPFFLCFSLERSFAQRLAAAVLALSLAIAVPRIEALAFLAMSLMYFETDFGISGISWRESTTRRGSGQSASIGPACLFRLCEPDSPWFAPGGHPACITDRIRY